MYERAQWRSNPTSPVTWFMCCSACFSEVVQYSSPGGRFWHRGTKSVHGTSHVFVTSFSYLSIQPTTNGKGSLNRGNNNSSSDTGRCWLCWQIRLQGRNRTYRHFSVQCHRHSVARRAYGKFEPYGFFWKCSFCGNCMPMMGLVIPGYGKISSTCEYQDKKEAHVNSRTSFPLTLTHVTFFLYQAKIHLHCFTLLLILHLYLLRA